MSRPVRLSVRAILLRDARLLMVNAFRSGSDLLCAPGGGVEPGRSLPDNLIRELREETGLTVRVGDPCLINEFHAPGRDFHQVDIYFRCTLAAGDPDAPWTDPEGVVSARHWLTRGQLAMRRFKPDCLPEVVWDGAGGAAAYDPLEPLVR